MNLAPNLTGPAPAPGPRRLPRWLARPGLALALGLAAAAAAWADPPARVGRVNWTEGQVTLQQAADPEGEQEAESVESPRNWPVTTGDSLVTGDNARTEVSIGSTLVRLGENTRLEVARLDDEAILLRLIEGSLALRVNNDELARGLDVQAGSTSISPQGAGLFRVDAAEDVITATAWRSNLRIDGPDTSLTVTSGQRADFGATGGWFRMGTPEIDRFASWAMNQNERYGEVAEVSPEMTGADELDEYGDWSTHPEYGRVWAPHVVETGWVPYRHGRWAWVRPWGWTWIDAAPWGFAPFHYGRWVQWGPRWVWAPGTWVARPTYAPAVVGWIGSPGLSISVNIGPTVGWFPLAPHEIYSPYYYCSPRYVRHVNYSHVPRIERAELYVGGHRTVHAPPRHHYRYRDDSRVYSTLPGSAFQPRRPRIVSPGTSPLRPPRDDRPPLRPAPGLPIAGSPGFGTPVAGAPVTTPPVASLPRPGNPRGPGNPGGSTWHNRLINDQPAPVSQVAPAPRGPAARPAPSPGRMVPLPVGGPRQLVTPEPGRPVQREPRPGGAAPAVIRPGWSTVRPQAQPQQPAAPIARIVRSREVEQARPVAPRPAQRANTEQRQAPQQSQFRRGMQN
jgi:hypothetical protein